MDDITIPSDPDDDRLFIRSAHEKTDAVRFDRTPIDDDLDDEGLVSGSSSAAGFGSSSGLGLSGGGVGSGATGDFVKIKFANFVQLVANHSYIDIVDKNAEQDVVVSGNLLTDLANAHDRARERKMPLMFIGGLVIGIILTYIILK